MKIAFLNIYNGVIDRGAETFVKELAQRLALKHDVSIFQGGTQKLSIVNYQVSSISIDIDWTHKDTTMTLPRLFFLDYWSRKIFWFTLKVLPQIWEEKFDIIIPLNGGWQPALVRVITWLYAGKVVISGQSGIGWDDRNNLWCFPNAFVALSSRAKVWVKRVNPLVRVEYIPNGVDKNKFRPEGKKFKTTLKKPIVLCVAALTPSKQIDLLMKAVAKTHFSLLLIGDGELRDKISNLGKEMLGDRFELIKMPYEDLPAAYRAADIFSLPSAPFQSFEIVIVEALATNLPVVANDDKIRQEIVGDAGLFVDPTNTARYAEALQKALDIKWENKPRKQAERFSWDKIVQKYEDLFKSFLN